MQIFQRRPKRNIRIFAVDDDPLQLRVLSACLNENGFDDVTVATSPTAALHEIELSLQAFDIFLLDIQMPGMDGISLCRRIRERAEYSDAVVIMITSLADRNSVQTALAAGATDYVTKPFDPLELITRIKVACDLAKAKTKADDNEHQLSSLLEQSSPTGGFSTQEPINLTGIPSVIDYVLLCNFVLQLTPLQTFTAHAFAVRIDEFDEIVLRRAPAEVYQLLLQVAKPLSVTLAGRSYFISYAGSGVFVCVSHKYDWMTVDDIMDIVSIDLEDLSVTDSAGESQPIRLVAGPRIHNRLHSTNRRIGLVLRAIDAARAGRTAEPNGTKGMWEKVRRALRRSKLTSLLRSIHA